MGIAKRMMMEAEENGWHYSSQSVCFRCVDDGFMSRRLSELADQTAVCDFCGEEGAAPVDVLLQMVMTAVLHEFSDADSEGVPYETREGGYQVAEVFDESEVVDEVAGEALVGEGLFDAVVGQLVMQTWVRRGWNYLTEDEALAFGWQGFEEAVKHRTRSTFWFDDGDPMFDDQGSIPASQMLHTIARLVQEQQLVRSMGVDTNLWRARSHAEPALVPGASAKSLGTVPVEFAYKPNRMSAPGIPMFYGALDASTAECEVVGQSPCHATIGVFKPHRPIWVLDLTKLPPVPSIFDSDEAHLRAQLAFLHAFVGLLQKPVSGDPSAQYVEYAPTQVLTEFAVHAMGALLEPKMAIDGLAYPSAASPGGVCLALDVTNERCVEVAPTGWEAEKFLHLLFDASMVQTRDLSSDEGLQQSELRQE